MSVAWRTDQILERTDLYSPLALRLVDAFTGGRPLGRVEVALDVADRLAESDASAEPYRPTDIAATLTPGGFVTYPGFGRSRDNTGLPLRCRLRLLAEFYRPQYPPRPERPTRPGDGFYFNAYPYSDEEGPREPTPMSDLQLLPATTYPYPDRSVAYASKDAPETRLIAPINLLRGSVTRSVNGRKRPVVNAQVHDHVREKVLTDERGAFALSLRWYDPGTPGDPGYPRPTLIDVFDPETGATQTRPYTLPDDLYRLLPIELP